MPDAVAPHTFEQVAAARGKSFVDDRINKAEKKARQQAAEILQLRRDVEAAREKTAAAQAEAQKQKAAARELRAQLRFLDPDGAAAAAAPAP